MYFLVVIAIKCQKEWVNYIFTSGQIPLRGRVGHVNVNLIMYCHLFLSVFSFVWSYVYALAVST